MTLHKKLLLGAACAILACASIAAVTLVNLANQVTGTLPAANGGTAVTNFAFSGNTHTACSTSGGLTSGDLVQIDANGNCIDSGSPVPTVTAVQTSGYTAAAGQFVPCNTTGGGFTVTLPASSANKGEEITVKISAGGSASNPVTIAGTGGDSPEVTSFYALHSSVTFVADGSSTWYVK